MSAFGGTADMKWCRDESRLMTQSGHLARCIRTRLIGRDSQVFYPTRDARLQMLQYKTTILEATDLLADRKLIQGARRHSSRLSEVGRQMALA